jgi:hypothetical protein
MDIAGALRIVIDLARQNIIDRDDDVEEHERQNQAINMVEDLAVNQSLP